MSGYPPPLDSGRNPFELWVLGFGLVVGTPLLFGAPTPGSTTEALGTVLVRVWAWLLVGGCLIALVGVWWTWWGWLGRWISRWRPTTLAGVLIEGVGLVPVATGMVIFAVGVIDFGGAALAAGLVGSWGLACLWRVRQIRRWVKANVRAAQGTDG